MTPVDHRDRRADAVVWALRGLCALAALAAAVLLVDDRLRFLPDERDYLRLALNLAHGRGFTLDGTTPTAFRPPGFAWLLAAVALVRDDVVALKCVGLVLWLAAAVLTGRVARRIAGPPAEAAALALVLCYPALLYSATTLYPQTLAWLLCAMLAWLALRDTHEPRALALGGAAGALLVLTVPNLAPVVLAYAAAILWSGAPRRAARAGAVLAIVAVGLGIWTLRNFFAFDAFVPLSTNSGLNFFMGNSPAADWDSGVGPAAALDSAAFAGLSEPDRNRALAALGRDWIAANPLAFLRLTLLKLANWFGFRNTLASGAQPSLVQQLVMFVSYYAILGLALARLALRRRAPLRPAELLLLASYLLVGAGYALFFTRIRFRLPVDFILIVAAAVTLAQVAQRRGRGWASDRRVGAAAREAGTP